MFRLFEGRTADEVWQSIASTFRSGEDTRPQTSRAGATQEILHATISIENPTQRWVISRQPPINAAFAIAELIWIMNGRNDSKFLNYFNRQLPKFAGQGNTYHGAYGHRLQHHFGINQLERAYDSLKHKPYSRQVVLQIWDSHIDFPGMNGSEAAPDIPCNIVSMLKVRNDKLEWMQIVRSNDIHRGLPYDLVLFTTLQEIIAGWLGLKVGTYNHLSDSLHLYGDCLEHLQRSRPLMPIMNTDSLAFPKEISDKAFQALDRATESITDPTVSAENLLSTVRHSSLPQPFRNLLCLVSAEGVRRRGRIEYIHEIMSCCTNSAYRQLYSSWFNRVSVLHTKTGTI